jgi:multiple sugar transport system ATP-binding protein
MRVEIARLHDQLQTTMIYVTHDQVEAMTLADRIVILNKGKVEQQGSPLELYQRPANRFVASFLGQPRMNFIPTFTRPSPSGPVLSIFRTDRTVLPLGPASALAPGSAIDLGVRPDAITVVEAGDGYAIPARIVVVEHLGGSSLLYVEIDGVDGLVTIEQRGKTGFSAGQAVHLRLDPEEVHLFDGAGERIVWI